MTDEALVLLAVLQVSLFLSVLFLGYAFRRRETRGVRSLAVMFVGISFWIIWDTLTISTGRDPITSATLVLRLLGPDIAVIAFVLFSLEYTGRERLLSRKLLAVLSVKPIVTVAVVVPPHRSQFLETAVTGSPWGYRIVETPFWLFHTVYNWVLLMIAIVLIGDLLVRATSLYRRQIAVLLPALTIPFAFNLLFHAGVVDTDLTSSSFFLTGVLFLYTTAQLRLVDAIPIARQTVLSEMEDMVVVLDENGTIISVNDAVRETLDGDSFVNQPVEALFGDGVSSGDSERYEIETSFDGQSRYLEINSSQITDYRGNTGAQLLVCRDISEKKQRQAELRRREAELELLKDLQSRVLRHNLRNELNVVRANTELVLDDDDTRELRDLILERTDNILESSTKARTIEQLVGSERTDGYDLVTVVEDALEGLDHTAVRMERDLPAAGWVTAVPQLDRAIENVLDNAVCHNTASDPRVRVTVEVTDETVIFRVADNGPGIEPGEIEAIQSETEQPLTHGSGMGLWVVYWVVEKSGGDLAFETGDGTTVTIRFDRAPADQRAGDDRTASGGDDHEGTADADRSEGVPTERPDGSVPE